MFYFDLFEDASHVDLELAFEAEGDLSLPINHERIFFFIAHSNVDYLAHVLKWMEPLKCCFSFCLMDTLLEFTYKFS